MSPEFKILVLLVINVLGQVHSSLGYTECYSDVKETDYRGTVSVTVSGRTCQKWTSQSPHPHADWTPQTRPNEGLGDHNYCRTAGWNGDGAWCYTTDPAKNWEYCDLPEPKESCGYTECYYDEKQTDYRGTVSVTVSDRTCQKWTSQSPHPHADWTPQTRPNEGLGDHNYCRTAGWNGDGAWCYTTDPAKNWEYCDLPKPKEGCGCTYPSSIGDVAEGKSTKQSSDKSKPGKTADKAVDGNTHTCSLTKRESEPWWTVDLGKTKEVYEVVIFHQEDKPHLIKTAEVHVGNDPDFANNPQCGAQIVGSMAKANPITVECATGCAVPMKGRYVSIQLKKDKKVGLVLCEVKVRAA
ncbi:plasminogen-like isoform X3 [Glandiceps talaboti]